MNGSSFSKMLFTTEDGQISIDRGSLSEREISHKDSCVSGDGMTRVHGKRAKRDSHIAGYVSMDMDGTERAGDIADRFSLCDGNVGTKAGAIVIVVLVFGETGKGKDESYRSKKDQPGGWKKVCAHEQPRGVVYAAQLPEASLRQESSSSECYPLKNMSHELPKAYDPSALEERWAKYWAQERLFDVVTPENTDETRKKFTILLPPAQCNGPSAHGAHAQPNRDGRSHPLASDVLRDCGLDSRNRPRRHCDADDGGTSARQRRHHATGFGTRSFRRSCVAMERGVYGGAILDQMKRLGASVDWSREYFTMDDRLSVAVKECFVRLWEQGLIYRGAYIVNWDPAIQTAVSDLEVEHEERAGKIYHIRYPLADGTGSIVVATTRPETMLGDVAVAVNPSDERYTALIGKILKLPLSGVNGGQEREIPILADDWAKPEFRYRSRQGHASS